ncbi:MAG: hypothetical protein SO402_09515 [Prevotella sp.]|nr:hypothetical protein [Prevotella sp.]MDY4654574.1 hypothetical protein [Prevotella sp.]
MRHKYLLRMLWIVMIMATYASVAKAQEFKVTSVKTMKNDVSAFISPVRDLNEQACALIKVEAPSDFVFSTPLGIVKRQDEVGEILLYVPNGTKMITIKHPEWGVLRNYRFEQPLESHICYVMKISTPQLAVEEIHDTLVITETRVDTVMVKSMRKPLPRSWWVMATVSATCGSFPVGVMLATMKRHGVFLHATTDFRSTGDIHTEVDKNGMPADESQVMPYFTGKKSRSNYMLTVGLTHRLSSQLTLLEGVGYGKTATAWQLAEEEGGGYALNSDMTRKGVAAEMGLVWNTLGKMVLLSVSTIEFSRWQVNIGFGIKIGKK